MFFFDRRTVGRVGHKLRFTQMLCSGTRITEDFLFELSEAVTEKAQLPLVHVLSLWHFQQFCLSGQIVFGQIASICAALVATAGVFAGAGAAFLAAATCVDTGAFAAVVLLAAGFVALVTM
jgi:hypothetical protein